MTIGTVAAKIVNRFSGAVIFEAAVNAGLPIGGQIGALVNLAIVANASLVGADLNGADLRGANLRGVSLSSANLVGANLNSVDLRGANLSGAHLNGVDLRGVDLHGAHLNNVDLRGVDLRGVHLNGVDLGGANLRGVDLNSANLVGANLRGEKIVGVIAAASRFNDPYPFMAWRAEDGRCIVTAGCRGPWPIERYRRHVADEYPGTKKAYETRAILNFFETRDRATAEVGPAT